MSRWFTAPKNWSAMFLWLLLQITLSCFTNMLYEYGHCNLYGFDLEKPTLKIQRLFGNEKVYLSILYENVDSNNRRLSSDVTPTTYNITLEPHFTNFTFKGHVEISIRAKKQITYLTLHAAQLKILNIHFYDGSNHTLSVDKTYYTEAYDEYMVIRTHPYIKVGSFSLHIDYTGFLNTTDNMGFFRHNYTVNGITSWLVATVFSPTYARRAFPCFDEPPFKAQFQVNIVREPDYTSLSNMKLNATRRQNGKFVDTFVTTPNISTYQLAFIIFQKSHFSNVADNKVRVFARRDDIIQGRAHFALKMSTKILKQLSTFTSHEFLHKIDLVAIPDFPHMSCESLGLLMYAENYLLSDWLHETAEKEQQIWLYIAHEMILQWFGSYVTPSWWNVLWMMEGITTLLDYQLGQEIKPLWRMDQQVWIQVVQPSFELDAEIESRPMTRHAMFNKYAIADMFDPITYKKAASVLRMLQHVLTPNLFQKGLIQYLTNKKYNISVPDDLWSAMEESIDRRRPTKGLNINISTFMKDWALQPHYPIITASRHYDQNIINLTQEPIRDWTGSDTYEGTWHVPINWATQRSPDFENTLPEMWLSTKETWPEFSRCENYQWLILNKQATGFYRVNYDETNWILIANELNSAAFGRIHVLNRAQLIDDAFHLAKAGRINYGIALNLTNYLHRETDYIVTKAFFSNLEFFNKIACWSPLYASFEDRVATILQASSVKLGFKSKNYGMPTDRDQHHIDNLHRTIVIWWACQMGNKFCQEGAISKLADLDKMDDNLKFQIVCGALRGADETTWNMVDGFVKSHPELLSALGCSGKEALLLKFIEREMVKKNIKVFEYIYKKGNFGTNFVFHYFLSHYDEIYKTFGVDTAQIPLGLSKLLGTERHLFLMKDLKRRAKEDQLIESFDIAITNINYNLDLANKFLPDITTWFKNNL